MVGGYGVVIDCCFDDKGDNCCYGEGYGDIEVYSDRSSNFGSDGSIGG